MWPAIIGSVVGGLLAGRGGSSSTETKRELDPAMRPYIFDQGGLVPQARKLFEQQTAPGGMPGFQDMRDRGRQLMGGSVAGNPFASGYTGGGLFGGAGGMHTYTPPPAPPPAPAQQPQQQPQMSLDEWIRQQEAAALMQYLMSTMSGGEGVGVDGFGGGGMGGMGGESMGDGDGGVSGVST